MKCAEFCTLFFIYMCAKINCSIPFLPYLCNRIPKLRSKMYIALTWVGVSKIFK